MTDDEKARLVERIRAAPDVESAARIVEEAVGSDQESRGRGNPGKKADRDWAALNDAVMRIRGERQSTRKLANIVGVSRTAVQKWRKEPDYEKLVQNWIGRGIT